MSKTVMCFRHAIALLALSTLSFATAAISGNLQDAGGAAVSGRVFVRFWLRGCSNNQPRVNGVALIAPLGGPGYYKDFVPDAGGAISGNLYKNSEIECNGATGNTWYGVQVYRDGKPGPETPYSVINATFNLNSATPTVQAPPPPPATFPYIMANPIASQAISNFPLSFGAGSGISANYQGALQAAGRYLRSDGSSFFAPVSASQIAGDIISAPNLNGLVYWNGSAFGSGPTGGIGTFCAVSTNGGAPTWSSCAGSASTAWSALSAPSANLALNMGTNRTSLSWSSAVSGGAAFEFLGGDSWPSPANPTVNIDGGLFPLSVKLGGVDMLRAFGVAQSVVLGPNLTLGAVPLALEFTNSTGSPSRLVKFTGSNQVGALSTADTARQALGIGVQLFTANMTVGIAGMALCDFDNARTAGNWVVPSTITGGQCHDAGFALPSQGAVGRVGDNSVSAGTGKVLLQPTTAPIWSSLAPPSADLLLNMGNTSSTLTWSGNGAGTAMFKLATTAGNTFGGYLLNVAPGDANVIPLGIGTNLGARALDVQSNGVLLVGQNGTAGTLAFIVGNEAATGTGANLLAKLNGSGQALKVGTTDTSGLVIGICVAFCGTSGAFSSAHIAFGGIVSCVFDNATTAGNWAVVSSTVAGNCHDSGATAPPATTITSLGHIIESAAAGTRRILLQISR